MYHGAHVTSNQADLEVRCPAMESQVGDSRGLLTLQASYPFAEELVQIAAGDGDEFETLEERVAIVERFVEDAPVEVEPAELPVVDGRRICQFIDGEIGKRRGQRRISRDGRHGRI